MNITPIDQRKYTNLYLGDGKTTVAQAGCFSCCLSMITGRSIEDTLKLLKSGGAFNGAYLKHPQDALALGFETYQSTTTDPKKLCIAEVDFNPDPDKDQHFVVWLGDGFIIDPWGGVQKKNPYKVYSYRIYEPIINNEIMNKDFVEQVALSCGKSKDFFGDNINEKEQEDATKRLKEARETIDIVMETAKKDREDRIRAEKEAIVLSKKLGELESSVTQENTPVSNGTAKVVSIDDFTLGELAGAIFRKITRL